MQVDRRNSRGPTMLWYAVARRDYKKMLFFLRCGADATVPDSEGTTPFHVALIKGDTLTARILLDSVPATKVSSILHNGRLNLDQLLLDHAQFPDSTEAMNFLLDLGANMNTVNSNHETTLMLATRCGDLRAMEALLRRGNIDIYKKDRYGSTALHIAVKGDQSTTVDLLLSCQQFDVNCQDSRGNTPFWLSMPLGRDDISERFLKDSRVDVNVNGCVVNSRWRTTGLYIASFCSNPRMVSSILASTGATRVDPNILGDGRHSPLGAAAYQRIHELVALLLKADGIRVNAADEGEDDPHWLAIQTRSTSVIELFLRDSRLNVNCQNNIKGDTYLLAAARDGNTALVNRVLEIKGVGLDARNKRGECALSVSCLQRHHRIFQMLLDRDAK
ncbi:hypothetical protein N7466_001584 [Penicillium verhagenii]|uniref:uncharacterized protein n=1 Tax=Penicillium verhagenii TaxID=1562060 RepID=UPI002544E63D|nr:uncharacterized protein N7466_001584 [Penicillium verhagenii]KAJ5938450.1 hypothetical protein N7466_001584 [Penicillium verhagenii]